MRPLLSKMTLASLHCLAVRLISSGSSAQMSVTSDGLVLPDCSTKMVLFSKEKQIQVLGLVDYLVGKESASLTSFRCSFFFWSRGSRHPFLVCALKVWWPSTPPSAPPRDRHDPNDERA